MESRDAGPPLQHELLPEAPHQPMVATVTPKVGPAAQAQDVSVHAGDGKSIPELLSRCASLNVPTVSTMRSQGSGVSHQTSSKVILAAPGAQVSRGIVQDSSTADIADHLRTGSHGPSCILTADGPAPQPLEFRAQTAPTGLRAASSSPANLPVDSSQTLSQQQQQQQQVTGDGAVGMPNAHLYGKQPMHKPLKPGQRIVLHSSSSHANPSPGPTSTSPTHLAAVPQPSGGPSLALPSAPHISLKAAPIAAAGSPVMRGPVP
eukprot:CAMPEP_0206152322 /NCGR_PEP_ID=MMETSP1473-20131121/39270_1 /ASSEMBLY_ACC=CAM_ASM_001109 /TAXON_ID=1461547 /ORGANISM="Stichococcus sp, Strain RCC1054" /LENGTH=261 /DNA_ID=CAMNT_0053549881 /DNA_START=220 /DNA_END=1001 /DNA_ORIENTATION=-